MFPWAERISAKCQQRSRDSARIAERTRDTERFFAELCAPVEIIQSDGEERELGQGERDLSVARPSSRKSGNASSRSSPRIQSL